MRQVFFKTVDALEAAASTAGDARFNDLESGKLGFWNLDAATGGDWFATALFQAAIDTDAEAGDDTTGLTTIANPIMLKRSLQVVQGFTSGNPIATPIINTRDVVRVTAEGYVASTKHQQTVTFAAGDAGDEVQLRFVVRTAHTGYLDYVNGETAFSDLTGEGYHFPLGVFNTTNHKVINFSFTATNSGSDNGAAACVTAIEGNETLNAMFNVAVANTNTVTFDARHAGVIFDIIADNLTGSTSLTVTQSANWTPGVGNAWQARTDELKSRAMAGHYNRMYFPMDFQNFVTAADTEYDRYEITYKIDGDRAVVKGSQYGTAIIYEVNGQNDVGVVLNAGTADPVATKTEYVFA
jgi:hypothetical protein